MRLTDEEIYEKAHKNTNEFFDELAYESGMKAARDFYENQKCETCKENGQCSIQVGLEEYAYKSFPMDEKDFGCNQWEPKK